MLRYMTLGLTVLLTVALAHSAPKRGDERPALYLPTAVGDNRVFETTSPKGKTAEVPEWVAAVEPTGAMTVVSFTREEGGPVLYKYGASAGGVFRVSAGDHVYDPPYQLLKLPAKEGETWEAESPAGPGAPPYKFKYTTG